MEDHILENLKKWHEDLTYNDGMIQDILRGKSKLTSEDQDKVMKIYSAKNMGLLVIEGSKLILPPPNEKKSEKEKEMIEKEIEKKVFYTYGWSYQLIGEWWST